MSPQSIHRSREATCAVLLLVGGDDHLTLADGALCESTGTGFECRDDVTATTVDGSRYAPFVVGSGRLPNGALLVLLRRIDRMDYPLLALAVKPVRPNAAR